MLLGGRVGYVLFYNFEYYLSNPFDIIKIWESGSLSWSIGRDTLVQNGFQ